MQWQAIPILYSACSVAKQWCVREEGSLCLLSSLASTSPLPSALSVQPLKCVSFIQASSLQDILDPPNSLLLPPLPPSLFPGAQIMHPTLLKPSLAPRYTKVRYRHRSLPTKQMKPAPTCLPHPCLPAPSPPVLPPPPALHPTPPLAVLWKRQPCPLQRALCIKSLLREA